MSRGFETTTGLVIQQGIFEGSTVQKHNVGTRMQLADGRVFHYAKSGGAMTAGKLVASIPTTANHAAQVQTNGAANAIGAKTDVSVYVGGTAVTANQYAEGYLQVNLSTGLGHQYKIKSHPLSAGTAIVLVDLYDPIRVATSVTSEMTLIPNPWSGVITMATYTAPPAGVPLNAYTSGDYCWVQTWGVCAVYCGAVVALGAACIGSTSNGAIGPYVTATELNPHVSKIVGHMQGFAGAAGDFAPVNLTIAP